MDKEKILSQFKTVHVKTVKVVGQNAQLEPIYENLIIKLSNHEWPLWVDKCLLHGYKSVEVIDVLIGKESVKTPELLAGLQSQIDIKLKPVVVKKTDPSGEIEALKAANDALLKRLEVLESKTDEDKSERAELIQMANELGLKFAKNIKTDALKSLIENSK